MSIDAETLRAVHRHVTRLGRYIDLALRETTIVRAAIEAARDTRQPLSACLVGGSTDQLEFLLELIGTSRRELMEEVDRRLEKTDPGVRG